MKHRFFIVPSFDGTFYSLKREGERAVTDFRSISEAIDYACACPEGLESKIRLYDFYGINSIEFPANVPRTKLSILFMFFQDPSRN